MSFQVAALAGLRGQDAGAGWRRTAFRAVPRRLRGAAPGLLSAGQSASRLPERVRSGTGLRPASTGSDQAARAISTGRLHALPRLHPRPIDVVVCHGSRGRPYLEGGFPLRCLQRLSRPDVATLRCGWRHNRSTSGPSTPVLSYWGQLLSSLRHPRQIGTELSHDVLNPAHVPL